VQRASATPRHPAHPDAENVAARNTAGFLCIDAMRLEFDGTGTLESIEQWMARLDAWLQQQK
jgi:hypothetical protein